MSSNKDHRYGIGAVARLTGLSDHTIRVWERRYDAVVAERSANGRRVYGSVDVEKLGLLKTLTDQGLAIGQIAGEDLESLRQRVRSLGDLAPPRVPDRVAIAVLGDFLPGQLSVRQRDIAPVEVLVADSGKDSFVADISRHDIDIVVLECPVLDTDAVRHLQELVGKAGASGGVLVYTFGRSRDVARAHDARIITLRAPVGVEDLRAAVVRAYEPPAVSRRKGPAAPGEPDADRRNPGSAAPRRFTNRQLSTLAHASTGLDCECPRHLVQLVSDLTAFEVYSAQCANRDDDDAALHRYLHGTTAQARALIEAALERVAEAEGIGY